MAGGAAKQEIEYLTKKAWIEQHEQTQKLNRDELWQLLAGISPNEAQGALLRPARSGWATGASTSRSTTA